MDDSYGNGGSATDEGIMEYTPSVGTGGNSNTHNPISNGSGSGSGGGAFNNIQNYGMRTSQFPNGPGGNTYSGNFYVEDTIHEASALVGVEADEVIDAQYEQL